jgi:Ca2+:H+ antiporter
LQGSRPTDMLRRMSGKAEIIQPAENTQSFGSAIRAEFPLLIGLATVAIFLVVGSRLDELTTHAVPLLGVFAWLFAVILWSAMCVVRHADCLAIKLGEPYGTLILTLSAISIEVVMISTAMLHGANNPTLGRDAIFAVIMIALGGLVGLSLMLGGLRYREQHYNIQGVNAYLNVIMALAVLGLVLYSIFLLIQTLRHRGYFLDVKETATKHLPHHLPRVRSTGFHSVVLLLYLAAVIFLAEKFAVPLDNSIEQFHMPQAFGGAVIAALVLSPEGLGGIAASLHNQLQRSINILFGSVLATIGLTIPAVLMIGLLTKRPVALGVQGGNLPLLLLTLAVSVVTFASRKTNVLQGCIHLLLFAVFVLLIFAP